MTSTAAIMAAGGTGSRARGPEDELPKQLRRLGDRTVLEWSLAALSEAACSPIILVVPRDLIEEISSLVSGQAEIEIVGGGETRQRSVANGLERVLTDTVVVHDAARPFASSQLVRRVISALGSAEGAIAALPLDETVKEVDGEVIVKTLDRRNLWRAQTPQAFRTSVLRQAHDRALTEGLDATDDAQLVERYGGKVIVVEGERLNLKLTHPDDFEIASAVAGLL
jgi:2-C-methyl-D-erythritol 4-phosphate cytidylyltransferase/2-C-methyl-D-erythritol 2,4-cyclodiphosphate synthase